MVSDARQAGHAISRGLHGVAGFDIAMACVQVHVPLYDPSTVMLLAVCVAQPKVHRARIVTRAVRSMLAQVPPPTASPLH